MYKSYRKTSPTKKLWKKIDKVIPGFSSFVDPIQILDINKNEEKYLDLVSSLILAVEKSSKDKIGKRKRFSKLTKLQVLKNQNYRCSWCGNRLESANFDHINDDRTNNHLILSDRLFKSRERTNMLLDIFD